MGVHQMCQNNNHLHFASHWIIWWFSFSCPFVFRSCKTLARQTRLRMKSSRNIYKILILSKSMPPDSTRISITTSDVSEVSQKFKSSVKMCYIQPSENVVTLWHFFWDEEWPNSVTFWRQKSTFRSESWLFQVAIMICKFQPCLGSNLGPGLL